MTVAEKVPLPRLHQEYHLWMKELHFFEEEIELFENLLNQIKDFGPCYTSGAEIIFFQHQFMMQKTVVENLRSELQEAEKKLTRFVHAIYGMGLGSIKMENHVTLQENINAFKKSHAQLKNKFRLFEIACRKPASAVS